MSALVTSKKSGILEIPETKDFKICKFWNIKKTQKEGWYIVSCQDCICEFAKNSYPIEIDIVRIYKENDRYKFKHIKRYYRGIEPRYLEKEEHFVGDGMQDFDTIHDLLTYLKST